MGGSTYNERLQRIVDRYRDGGRPWPSPALDIAAWAIWEPLWAPQPAALIGRCAEDLARAMREECIVDAQDWTVRANHAARVKLDGEQAVLWADIRTAGRRHTVIAFQQRRQQTVGDCRQLKVDVDSYNENANAERPIQMVFDFTQDLAELETRDAAEAVAV